VLLHGWTATADLNWQTSYQALGRHFRVIAFDHRGHGRGLRAPAGFRLEDCADDVAAVAAQLGVDRCIPVGYSMGGPIASLVWRRHPELVEGLVLCATSRHFAATPARRAFFSVLNGTSAVASTTPVRAIGRWSGSAWTRRLEHRDRPSWMVEQVLLHDWTQVVDAGRAIGRFDSRRWAGSIDVPTAVLVSLDDDVVPTRQQFELARAVPGASVHTVPGGHTACMDRSSHFVSSVLDACRSVARRATERSGRVAPRAA
jgi:3-oxoadipate enol-lactonase